MELLPYTNEQLKETIIGFGNLASVACKKERVIQFCNSFGWAFQSDDSIVLVFETPCKSPFLVDLYNNDSVAGGFVALCLLEWDEYEGNSIESETSKAIFDKKYFETVSIASDLLGEPKFTFTESKPFQRSSVWQKENAFILVIQGADDIEGIDIRLWLEYFDGNDDIPDSEIFDWLYHRHLSKIE